ncbi:hypothetical protein DXG03_002016 [Asterophora parasitica]|uniref:F-box domain-containing protein n=1 Tax=Asterophora parasitica TaxID=117018 RepID=A0A9P7KCH8_9AGAR|nr:hypothetical protein DXG03_002016 [Asterophora parasitica]
MPPELIDSIIDHAHADPALLAACSLVSKAWFPAARHHLFSNAKLDAKNAPSFVNLIDSTFSTVAPFVRHIDAKDNCEGSRWVDSLFANLTSLPSVTSISLISSCDSPISQITLFTLCSFDRLVELKLAECEFGNFTEVQQLICSFPMLQSLYLEADWPEPNSIDPTVASPSPHLRELYLRCEMSHVLAWFLTQPSVAPVSKLTLHGLDAADLPVVSLYLQTLGPVLTHLTIPHIGSVVDSLSTDLNLSHNTGLRYLQIGIDADIAYLCMARALLSQVASPSFDEVELSFYSVRQGPKVARQWAELDALLNTPPLSSMTRATISTMSGSSLAKEVLPLSYERNILHVRRQ